MAAINTAVPIRFETGGILRLTDSTTDYDIENRETGTLRIVAGGYELYGYKNKGITQTPVEGDENISVITASVKLTSVASGQLLALAQARDTATGLVKLYTSLLIAIPRFKDSTDYEQWLFNGVWFPSQPVVTSGTELDTVELTVHSKDALPTLTSGALA